MNNYWHKAFALVLGAWVGLASADPLDDLIAQKQQQSIVIKGRGEAMPVASAADTRDMNKEQVGDLIMNAMGLLGVAYKFGGSSPAQGLDCSGFIQYIFKQSFRINLPRTSAEMAKVGQAVSRSDLMPGDLVFFNTRGFANSHVGMYLGNDRFIQSPRTGKTVEITSMTNSYWSKRFNGARRINHQTMNTAKFVK